MKVLTTKVVALILEGFAVKGEEFCPPKVLSDARQ